MRRLVVLTILLCAASAASGAEPESPHLGKPLTAQEAAATTQAVMPDGEGLPAGGGDAVRGAEVFVTNCLACHGEGGHGGPNDALVGGQGTLASDKPLKTIGSYWPYATTVFEYVHRAMPYQTPGSLSDDDVYAVTAYLLYRNGIIAEDAVMDAQTLPAVVMPNRAGFRRAYQDARLRQ